MSPQCPAEEIQTALSPLTSLTPQPRDPRHVPLATGLGDLFIDLFAVCLPLQPHLGEGRGAVCPRVWGTLSHRPPGSSPCRACPLQSVSGGTGRGGQCPFGTCWVTASPVPLAVTSRLEDNPAHGANPGLGLGFQGSRTETPLWACLRPTGGKHTSRSCPPSFLGILPF